MFSILSVPKLHHWAISSPAALTTSSQDFPRFVHWSPNRLARLTKLRDRVDHAGFEEKRRAVVELVKAIEIASKDVSGENTAFVTITCRFDQVPGVQQGRGTLVLNETLERTQPQRAFMGRVEIQRRSARSR